MKGRVKEETKLLACNKFLFNSERHKNFKRFDINPEHLFLQTFIKNSLRKQIENMRGSFCETMQKEKIRHCSYLFHLVKTKTYKIIEGLPCF